MGRIYRIREKGEGRREKVEGRKTDLGKMSNKELIAQFNNPSIWWRMTAQRLLLERQDKKAAPYLRDLCKSGKTPEARIHALRTLEGLGFLSGDDVEGALADSHPAV